MSMHYEILDTIPSQKKCSSISSSGPAFPTGNLQNTRYIIVVLERGNDIKRQKYRIQKQTDVEVVGTRKVESIGYFIKTYYSLNGGFQLIN